MHYLHCVEDKKPINIQSGSNLRLFGSVQFLFFSPCAIFYPFFTLKQCYIMNMYVSNLGYQTTSGDLKQLFEKFGVVDSVNVIMDRTTGKSRGFGFVEMSSQTEADEAMGKLNGQDVEGRTISVTVA